MSGVWNVTAVLSSNPCLLPAPAILTPTLDLVQAGSSLTGSWGAFYASGYVAGDSFVVSTPVYCFGSCCAVFALNMSGIVATPSGLAGSACVGWDGVCTDGTMCPVLWCG